MGELIEILDQYINLKKIMCELMVSFSYLGRRSSKNVQTFIHSIPTNFWEMYKSIHYMVYRKTTNGISGTTVRNGPEP